MTTSDDYTPISLLDRLSHRPVERDWERFVQVYRSLIELWLRRAGIPDQDRDDLIQEILTTLIKALPSFEHNGHAGAFRKWLRTLVIHRVLQFCRKRDQQPQFLSSLEGTISFDALQVEDRMLTEAWEREHDEHVLRQLFQIVHKEFTMSTWMAFQKHVLEGHSAAQVASELGLSSNAVLIAKSRVLKRLREEAAGFID